MGEVFLARHKGLAGFERLAVVKRIRPELSHDKHFTTLFLDEARLAAQLTHPKITHFYELGREGESYFVAMEYIPGCDLETLISASRSPLPIGDALYVTNEVLDGLSYAHNLCDSEGQPLGVVHRDLCPRNVLVSLWGGVKIADFGVAKVRNGVSASTLGIVMGTCRYMSPEQASGLAVDHRADIFATGLLLFRMVTGQNAYQGESTDLLLRARNGQYLPPSIVNSAVPLVVEEIILKAMHPNPERRYASATEMRRAVLAAAWLLSVRRSPESLADLLERRLPDLEAKTTRLLTEPCSNKNGWSVESEAAPRDRESELHPSLEDAPTCVYKPSGPKPDCQDLPNSDTLVSSPPFSLWSERAPRD
jgi:serine/threonine-protein kinase